MREVVVGAQQGQVVPDAQLREQSVDRAKLNAGATTGIAQVRGIDVILPVGTDEWQGGQRHLDRRYRPDRDDIDDDPPPTTTFELVCTPGQQRCADADNREVCKATGLDWESIPCTQYQKCEEGGEPLVAACKGPCESLEDQSIGCEFLAIRMRSANSSDLEEDADAIIVANTDTDKTAVVQLYLIPNYFTLKEEPQGDPVSLAPGESHTFKITNDPMPSYSSFRSGGVYRVISDWPVASYLHSPLANSDSNDASLLLPVKALGRDHIVASYAGYVKDPLNEEFSYGRPSYFNVIATENDTEIEWSPRAKTYGDGIATHPGEAFEKQTQKLNRFDVLQIGAASLGVPDTETHDLSGTIIRSNKPIVVMGGTACARVPFESAGGCNHLQEQILPLKYWGKQYIAPHAPFRSGDETFVWRVYGTLANQTISLDPAPVGVPPFQLGDVGSFKEITVANNSNFPKSFAFKSTYPFMPVQYLVSSADAGGQGDPAMYQTIPLEQHLKRYVFATGINYEKNYAQVLRKKGGAPVYINDTEVTGWYLVNASGGLAAEVADFELTNSEDKAYIAESDDPFGVNVIGYVKNSAYAYPAGMALNTINPDGN